MVVTHLSRQTGVYNLVGSRRVFAYAPSDGVAMRCQMYLKIGTVARPLDGSGGLFNFIFVIGNQTVQPSPQQVTFGTETESAIWSTPFFVPVGEYVEVYIQSPNGADTAVGVEAYLYPTGSGYEGPTINITPGVVAEEVV